jgi:hypothetical protein
VKGGLGGRVPGAGGGGPPPGGGGGPRGTTVWEGWAAGVIVDAVVGLLL